MTPFLYLQVFLCVYWVGMGLIVEIKSDEDYVWSVVMFRFLPIITAFVLLLDVIWKVQN